MKYLFVLFVMIAVGFGCGKSPKDSHEGHDHSGHGHEKESSETSHGDDHSGHDHGEESSEDGHKDHDHSGHDHGKGSHEDEHKGHDHSGHDHSKGGAGESKAEGHNHSEDEHSDESNRVGPGLAVEAYEVEEARIKLSEKAFRRLGLKVEMAALQNGVIRVPRSALGVEDGESFLYIQEPSGWLRRKFVTTGSRSGLEVPVLAGISPGMKYISDGASYVRLAELDLTSGEVGHVH